MENYEDILRMLSAILHTQLLAPSVNALAEKLGYGVSSRSSINRIKKGIAGSGAIDTLTSRIHQHLNIDINSLMRMEAAIQNAYHFEKLIKPQMNLEHKDWQFHAIYPFISHDFSWFSPEFRKGDMQRLLLLELTDPRAFFNMLAYFYVTSTGVKFYQKKNLTHKQRCAEIIEPLGERLISLFPSNGLAAGLVYSYSISDLFNAEAPILWSLVETIGSMLQAFASPLDSTDKENRSRLLPGLPDRAYWKGNDDEKILLLWSRHGKEPASGHYELFAIDKNSMIPVSIASLFFMSDEIMSVYIKRTSRSQFGVYKLEGNSMSFEWENPNDDPMQSGNKWELLTLESSQSLREIDRHLTDDALTREMAHGEGFDFDFAMQPADVIISRKQLSIVLKDGSKYSVDINFAPFLSKLTPAEPLMVCRQLSDGRIFAIWPEIRQSIPLDLFTSI
ncbi:MAG: hypothetical protein K2K75_08820 [Muribaculaceae bacterium]|nr:hypothetical protein [Muribaculaceae bacterium]